MLPVHNMIDLFIFLFSWTTLLTHSIFQLWFLQCVKIVQFYSMGFCTIRWFCFSATANIYVYFCWL